MQAALEQARKAVELGEVPVGAVAVCRGEIIAETHNRVESAQDATLHAEILAIRAATTHLGRWRLEDVDIYVTLEPCPMCLTALMLSRVRRIYFAASDPRMGACGSIFDLSQHPALPKPVAVFGGLLESEARVILQNFFHTARKRQTTSPKE